MVDQISFGKLVQNFDLKRVGGAPKSHSFAPLTTTNTTLPEWRTDLITIHKHALLFLLPVPYIYSSLS